jgi:hypothetical protein
VKLNDKHRSMIATAFVAAYDNTIGTAECKRRSLCCAPDADEACARIVGKAGARLRFLFYNELGCVGWSDPDYQDVQEQYFLDKISALEEL